MSFPSLEFMVKHIPPLEIPQAVKEFNFSRIAECYILDLLVATIQNYRQEGAVSPDLGSTWALHLSI